jgi:NitT/TauT family transport system substrate-binding protein
MTHKGTCRPVRLGQAARRPASAVVDVLPYGLWAIRKYIHKSRAFHAYAPFGSPVQQSAVKCKELLVIAAVIRRLLARMPRKPRGPRVPRKPRAPRVWRIPRVPRNPRAALAVLSLAVALTLAAALTVALTAVGASPVPASARRPKPARITVGILPTADAAPLYIAIRNGYFRRQDLVVTTKIIAQSTAALPDLVSGHVDIVGGGSYFSFFEAADRGTAKIKILAAASQCTGNTMSVLAMPKSKIKTAGDLVGKTIAVDVTGGVQTLTIDALLRDQGIDPAGITYVPIPFAEMPAALTAGRVDAISEVEPFIASAEQDGAATVLAQCQGSTTDMPLSGYFATQAWVRRHPGAALAFQRAIEQAQAAADASPALVQQVLPAFTTITPALAAQIALPYYPPTLNGAQLRRVAELMRSAGLVSGTFSVTPLLLRPGG